MNLDFSDYKGRKVVVTGADGFIGSHLAETLVQVGANVTALAQYNAFDRHGWLDEIDTAARDQMTLVRGDVRDPAFIDTLLFGQHICFNLAALIAIPYSYQAAQSYVDVNVTGAVNVFEAARRHGLERIVHTSTSEVYGTAITTPIGEDHPLQGQSPYSASKIAADMMAEAYARSFDLPVVILRPFNTYGPRQSERAVIASTIRQALDPGCTEIRVGDLTPLRDFTFATDTVAAFLAIGQSGDIPFGVPFNAGSGKSITIAELVAKIVALSGSNKDVRSQDERLRPEKSEVRELRADITRFQEITGWAPAVRLDDGLDATIGWWRQRLKIEKIRHDSSYIV